MLKVGLVGFGFAGKIFHAPVIRAVEGLHLTTIVQRNGGGDPRYADVDFVRSVDELLARPIDLVVVATPNTSHHPIAKQCLLAGKHVVVDKPFTVTLAEAEELVRIAEDKRVLSVYHNRRYVGDFVTLRKLLAENALGRVAIYESHFDRFRPEHKKERAWREEALPGSGVWYDLGPHLLDQALVLFGTPEAISADIRHERDDAKADDAFDVTLHYPRMRAMLRATVLAASPGATFTVHGTKGSFVKFGLDPQEEALKSGHSPNEPHWDEEPAENYGKVTTPDGTLTIATIPSSFAHYYENVRDAILGRAQLAVTHQQMLNVMRGLELAVESSRRRCAMNWS